MPSFNPKDVFQPFTFARAETSLLAYLPEAAGALRDPQSNVSMLLQRLVDECNAVTLAILEVGAVIGLPPPDIDLAAKVWERFDEACARLAVERAKALSEVN